MKEKREWTEEERLWAREGTIFVIILAVPILVSLYVFFNYFPNPMADGSSFIKGLRTITSFLIGSLILPGSILMEFTYSRIKRRSYRPKNILLSMLLFLELFASAFVLLTLFDLLFSGLPVLVQVPLAAIAVSVPSFLVAVNFKIPSIRNYFQKAFD